MIHSTLGFIGTGKITTAMVEAFGRIDKKPGEIWLSPRNEERAHFLSNKFSFCQVAQGNDEVVDRSQVLFLAIRPSMVDAILSTLPSVTGKWVYSMIPTLTIEQLQRLLPGALGYSRITPLVAISHFSSPVLFSSTNPSKCQPLIELIGEPVLMTSEKEHQALWVITGEISPYYEILNTMKQWALDQGVGGDTAGRYISGMSQSLSQLATKGNFAMMAEEAATPDGMNEQSIRFIKKNKGFDLFYESLEQIKTRFGL